MQQLGLFPQNSDDFLYNEIEKIRSSMDRRSRAMFALITEIQDQVIQIKEKGTQSK